MNKLKGVMCSGDKTL